MEKSVLVVACTAALLSPKLNLLGLSEVLIAMAGGHSDLMTDIPQTVLTHWNQRHSPVLLSSVGSRLPANSKAELRLIKRPLLGYIEEHLSDSIRLIDIPGKGLAAAPAEAAKDLSDAELIRRYFAAPAQPSTHVMPRFFPEVWASFARPLVSARRFIRLGDRPRPQLVEIGAGENAEGAGVEVLPEDIPAIDLADSPPPALVANSIRRWAEKNEVELSRLYVPVRETLPNPVDARDQGDEPAEGLAAVLNLLEPHELARINIPADLVLSLFQRLAGKR